MVDFKDIFPRECNLRDHLATHLFLIEDGLKLVETEFNVVSEYGADGRIDILAEDAFGHFVIIELKKSNSSARSALHELSKYITLLKEQEGLGRDEIRCVIVSSDWHELLEPFSYFHAVADVHVDGYHAVVDSEGSLSCSPVHPLPVNHLPTFSPEFDLFIYDNISERNQHWELISSRAECIPFVRVAMCQLDSKKMENSQIRYRSIICIWRINDSSYENIEDICEFKIGNLAPYAFPGWEPECDVLYWLVSKDTEIGFPGTAEGQRGTAEKVNNLLNQYTPVRILHCGRGVKDKTLNSIERVINLLRGYGPRLPISRQNPFLFNDTVAVSNLRSFEASIDSFLNFIKFVPFWQEIAREFTEYLKGMNNVHSVELKALNKKHFFYALYQMTVHPEANLSNFSMMLYDKEDYLIGGIYGDWSWDGTCPENALEAINQVYGNHNWAILSLFSAVDKRRYDNALGLHGFHPLVVFQESTSDKKLQIVDVQPEPNKDWTSATENPLRQLVETHPDYVAQLSEFFKNIPTEPGEGIAIINVNGTRDLEQ